MSFSTFPRVLKQIATGWRSALSVFLLLNLALLQAAAATAGTDNNNVAPAFSNEIKSAGPSLQRDLPRASLYFTNETGSGNNDDSAGETPLPVTAQLAFNKATLGVFVRPDARSGSGRYAYFLPEPRAAPQA